MLYEVITGVDTLKLSGEKIPRRIPAEADIRSLLKALVIWHGQDLHLSSGAIPSIRVDGEIKRLDIPALKPAEVESIV